MHCDAVFMSQSDPFRRVVSGTESKKEQVENLYGVIEASCPADTVDEVKRLLYGEPCEDIPVTKDAKELGEKSDFEIRAFKMRRGAAEDRRPARIVRIAAIQHPIYAATTEKVDVQYNAIEEKVGELVDAAGAMGVNVLGLQEAWTCPFFFCTRERLPWMEFAESAEDGRSVKFLQRKAREHNMVIISSILEIDENHADTIWNTAVVISNSGHVIGKTRKFHIPRVGDFNESTYYHESTLPQTVFETEFGRIGVNICYGRHFPQHWHMLALHGAEIVFNPSATVDGLSETLWPIEARNAAIANGIYTVAINRVGTERFPNQFTSGDGKPAHNEFGHFYGSSYIAGPSGQRTPPLSRTKAGLIVAEVDLNLLRQVRHSWNFHMCARWPDYVKMYTEQAQVDFKPPIVRDPLLDSKKFKNRNKNDSGDEE